MLSGVGAFAFIHKGLLTQDSIRYAIGAIDLHREGLSGLHKVFNGGMSMGYYLGLFGLLRAGLPVERLALIMNSVNSLSSVIAVFLLYRFTLRNWNQWVAFFSATLLVISPGFWQLGHYGHPGLPALAVFMGSLVILDRILSRRNLGEKGTVEEVIFCLLFMTAIMIRMDILMMSGVFFGLLFMHKGFDEKWTGRLFLLCLVSVIGVMGVRWCLFGRFLSMHTGTFLWHLKTKLGSETLIRSLITNTVIFALAAGPLTILAASGSFWKSLFKREYALVLLGLAWLVPFSLFLPFWGMDISRLTVPCLGGMTMLAAILIHDLFGRRRTVAAITFILLGQGIAILGQPLIEAVYPFKVRFENKPISTVPLGFVVQDSLRKERYVRKRDSVASLVTEYRDKDVLILGSANTMSYEFLLKKNQRVLSEQKNHKIHGLDVFQTHENSFYVYDADLHGGSLIPIEGLLRLAKEGDLHCHIPPFRKPELGQNLFLSPNQIESLMQKPRLN